MAQHNSPAEPARSQADEEQVRENQTPNRQPAPLAGDWVMALPAGFRYEVSLRRIEPGCYALEKAVRFSGVYERRRDRLVMVKPTDRDEGGFEWLIAEDCLILVKQRPVEKLGSDYRGATLKRTGRAESSGRQPVSPRRADEPKPQTAKKGQSIQAEVRGILHFKSGHGYFISVKPADEAEDGMHVWLRVSENKVLTRKLERLEGKEVIATGKLTQLPENLRASVPPLGIYLRRGFEIKQAGAK